LPHTVELFVLELGGADTEQTDRVQCVMYQGSEKSSFLKKAQPTVFFGIFLVLGLYWVFLDLFI